MIFRSSFPDPFDFEIQFLLNETNKKLNYLISGEFLQCSLSTVSLYLSIRFH